MKHAETQDELQEKANQLLERMLNAAPHEDSRVMLIACLMGAAASIHLLAKSRTNPFTIDDLRNTALAELNNRIDAPPFVFLGESR